MNRRSKPAFTTEDVAEASSSQPPLPSLFYSSHIDVKNMRDFVLLGLYLPFGFWLLFIRLFFLFWLGVLIAILSVISPDCFFFSTRLKYQKILRRGMIRILSPLFGIKITVRKPPSSPLESGCLIASNHISAFDVFPFMSVTDVNVLIHQTFFQTNWLLEQFKRIAGVFAIDREASKESPDLQAKMRADIVKQIENSRWPLLWFPEGWDTSGTVGLLQFQRFLFSVDKPVQPVAISARVPLLPLLPTKLGTTLVKEVLLLLFVPYYEYELRFLPRQLTILLKMRETGEKPEEFAQRVQTMIAEELGVVPTSYTYKDAWEYRKTLVSTTFV